MQRQQRNVQKSVMRVQSCCFANLTLFLFCRSRRLHRHRCLNSLMQVTVSIKKGGLGGGGVGRGGAGLASMFFYGICHGIARFRYIKILKLFRSSRDKIASFLRLDRLEIPRRD